MYFGDNPVFLVDSGFCAFIWRYQPISQSELA